MGTIRDVLEAVDAVAKAIESLGTIIDAVRGGREYFTKRYATAREDVLGILGEMNKSLITAGSVSSILTHFAFVDDAAQFAGDLRLFNDRIVASKAEIDLLQHNIAEYRGHCTKIQQHAEKIKQGTGLDSIFKMFGVDSTERNGQLSDALLEIHRAEFAHYGTVEELCESLKLAINHVHETLGWPGMLEPAKIPDAQQLLAEYAMVFMKVEAMANRRGHQVRELLVSLG